MDELFRSISSDASIQECDEGIPSPNIHAVSPDAVGPEIATLIDLQFAAVTDIDENYINRRRLKQFKKQFTPQLMHLIMDSDFEYGIESKVDVFIREHMVRNMLATRSWLNELFLEHFGHPTILIGILRAISRLSHYEIWPEGQTMALAALSHANVEVRECGIRALENWGNLESLTALQNLLRNVHVSPAWLKDYLERVIRDLEKELSVEVS